MTKGGAREASASKAVAKGMGIKVFFNVLEEIGNSDDCVTVDEVMSNLPQDFGGDRNETCRSYFKELWRYGLIERFENEEIVECNAENWKKGGRPVYTISKLGKRLLNIPREQRIFALAWLLVQMDNPDNFEQLNLALNTFREKEVPLSMFKACDVTGVVRDSIKAIMYGWLEPLGFIDRTDHDTFKLDNSYYQWLKSFKTMEEAVPKKYPSSVRIKNCIISTTETLEPYAPEKDPKAVVTFKIASESISKLKIQICGEIYPLFYNRFKKKKVEKIIEVLPKQQINLDLDFEFETKKISESFEWTELGIFKVKIDSEESSGALPDIYLTTASHLHEMYLGDLFGELGYPPITFTKSDRPDMIIFPDKKEVNLTKFLHNDESKILVETTSAEVLSLQKVIDDLDNFKEHTNKVLKINAKRTLIVGLQVAGNIDSNIPNLQRRYHPFTILSIPDLKYLIKKVKSTGKKDWKYVGKVLMYNGIVTQQIIDKAFIS